MAVFVVGSKLGWIDSNKFGDRNTETSAEEDGNAEFKTVGTIEETEGKGTEVMSDSLNDGAALVLVDWTSEIVP